MEMKIMTIAMVLIFFLSACSSPSYVCPDATVVEDASQCPPAEEPEPTDADEPEAPQEPQDTVEEPEMEDLPPVEPEEPELQMDPEVEELLLKYDDKVDSIRFNYVDLSVNQQFQTYYLKDGKMRVDLHEARNYMKGEWFDTVYMDLEAESAEGYCLRGNDVRCPNKSKVFEVDYPDFEIMTPSDWLSDVAADAAIEDSKTLEGRNAIEVSYTRDNGDPATIWIDEFYGMPMLVETDGSEHTFQDIDFNGVKDEDVDP